MRYFRPWLALVLFAFACTPDAKEVPATQLTVRVSAEESVRQALTGLRLRTSGNRTGAWALRSERTFDGMALDWPVDLVLVPSSDWKDSDELEIIVDALDASNEVLVQARVLTSFDRQAARIVPILLATCGTLGLRELCEPNASCYGDGCKTCMAGACATTPRTSSETLPALGPETDAGDNDSGDNSSEFDGSSSEPEAGAPAPGMERLDGGSLDSGPDSATTPAPDAGEAGLMDARVAVDGNVGTDGDAGACAAGFRRDNGICVDIDECATQNGGCPANSTCGNTPGGRVCPCNTGYAEQSGQCRDLCAGACDPIASCDATTGVARCSCPATHVTTNAGRTCTFDSSCSLLQCDTNATCTVTGSTRACVCRSGYTGPGATCSNVNECTMTPGICGTNSTCADTPGSYTCGCQSGYRRTGNACVKIPCMPNPCLNGGTCSESASGTAVCACQPGYSGPTCATNIDECAMRPCQNGGRCTDGVNTRTCACNSPFTGADCEAEICNRTVSIRSIDDLEINRNCAEITGNLEIAATGLEAITASDFPYLRTVRGDLRMTALAGSATTPRVASVNLSRLTSVEGQFLLGATSQNTLTDVMLPALTTIGRPGDTALRFYVVMNYTRSLRMPALTTIHGNAQMGVMPSLCTVDLNRVSTLTGKLDLINIWNVPIGSFTPMIQAATRGGGVTQTNIGCCLPNPSAQSNCSSSVTPICGC